MRSLLDISVVIALLDPDHDFHHRAHTWWASVQTEGWASCPITQNGVVRIMSSPAYNPRRSLSPASVCALLRTFIKRTDHEFIPEALSFLDTDSVDTRRVLGPRQVTDVYLLALAASRGHRLATFDESINPDAVPAAGPENLLII